MTAVEYIQLRAARADLVERVAARTNGFDALLMPTVAITAPTIAAFERDEDYRRLNALLLRNTSVINFLDCCAITVPIPTAGPPVGLMIVGEHGADRHLLGVGRGIEATSIELNSAVRSVF
jgi:aspartyl-tRNA(Asn)/glutamyl-tRNA(Gln) amidotransferase subunit A